MTSICTCSPRRSEVRQGRTLTVKLKFTDLRVIRGASLILTLAQGLMD